jgi:hypothetical protein
MTLFSIPIKNNNLETECVNVNERATEIKLSSYPCPEELVGYRYGPCKCLDAQALVSALNPLPSLK